MFYLHSFPVLSKVCILCQSPLKFNGSPPNIKLCPSCFSLSWSPQISPLSSNKCGQPPFLTYTLFKSHSPLYSLIKESKHSGNQALLFDLLCAAPFIFNPLKDWIKESNQPTIFVPLCPRRSHLQKRGGHPPLIIAQFLHQFFIKESSLEPYALKRVNPSLPQVKLHRNARLTAQKNTLKAEGSIASKTIIIVDDILTTGGTLLEAQRACLDAKADRCYAIALFRG